MAYYILDVALKDYTAKLKLGGLKLLFRVAYSLSSF